MAKQPEVNIRQLARRRDGRIARMVAELEGSTVGHPKARRVGWTKHFPASGSKPGDKTGSA